MIGEWLKNEDSLGSWGGDEDFFLEFLMEDLGEGCLYRTT